eukprot:8936948-Karenia_brevis.AAC.2
MGAGGEEQTEKERKTAREWWTSSRGVGCAGDFGEKDAVRGTGQNKQRGAPCTEGGMEVHWVWHSKLHGSYGVPAMRTAKGKFNVWRWAAGIAFYCTHKCRAVAVSCGQAASRIGVERS